MKVEVAVLGSPSLTVLVVFVDSVRQIELEQLFGAQELCKSEIYARPDLKNE